MQFDANGVLVVPKRKKQDHIQVFSLIDELDFPVGKKLLIQLLRGELNGKIKKLELDKKVYFGSLPGYDEKELDSFLKRLIKDKYIEIIKHQGKFPVVKLTTLGEIEFHDRAKEISIDQVNEEKSFTYTKITEQDKELFKELDFFLNEFTDEQKKAITCLDNRQLCVAGAGTGKTRVLTHKIVYLIKFCGINPKEILAITFTRKARREMISRLAKLGVNIKIETFNSFAEKELQEHAVKLYGQDKKMISGSQYVSLVVAELQNLGFSVEEFLEEYFTDKELQKKDQRSLFFSFLYDLRTIHDAYIVSGKDPQYFEDKINNCDPKDKFAVKNLAKLVVAIVEESEKRGLRSYGDQLTDIITLYKSFPKTKPQLKWMLVDEYQDVSDIQIQLMDLLTPQNIFVVGDPRQSIYAWRGATPSTMYDFAKKDTTVMQLTKNYRSAKDIVDFTNKLIKKANDGKFFNNLHAHNTDTGKITTKKYASETEEAKTIVQQITESQHPRNEIFVLSRTNKGLQDIAQECKRNGIDFLMRTDERKGIDKEPTEQQITLSTVHAIKGLEASQVFVANASNTNFPCRAKDHRFVDLLASKEQYDQYEEERRLLYVALTRAKEEAHVSYVGAPSPFLQLQTTLKEINTDRQEQQRTALRRYRFLEAQDREVPAYIIFSDKVLEQLLNQQPQTIDDLYMISGLGKAKISEFGDEILQTLHKN